MKCYKCPFLKDDFDFRIARLNGTDICGEIEWDEVEYDHVDYCYCEKMGAKLCITGRCSEAEMITKKEWDEYREQHHMSPIVDSDTEEENKAIDPVPKPTKKQKKRARDRRYKNHLRKIFRRSSFFSGAYPVDKEGRYDPENPVRYKREYNPPRAKWIKRHCNKRVRKGKDVPQNNGYRKFSEYMWELW